MLRCTRYDGQAERSVAKSDTMPSNTCTDALHNNLAALRAKMKLNLNYPPGPGRNLPKIPKSRKKMAARTLPRDLPGGREPRTN